MYLKYKYCLFYLAKLNKFNIFLDLGDNSRTLLVILVFPSIRYPSIIVALPLVRIIYPVSTVLCTRRIISALRSYALLFYPTVYLDKGPSRVALLAIAA